MVFAWRQPHFSQRGSYSIERLKAFNGYCKHTPLWRAIAVSLLFSLPAVVTSIALELIPLQNPFSGVKANPGALLRQFIIALITTLSAVVQIGQLVPQLSLSAVQIVATAMAASCCYITTMVTVASYWVYPIPFGEVIGVVPCAIFLILFFLLLVGRKRLQSSASLRRELSQQIMIVTAEGALGILYPLFSAVYNLLSPVRRMFFVVLLPVIKFLLQQFVAWAAKDLEDHQPGIVVFCVDVFNALYAAKSLQSASQSARLTPFIISGFDMIEYLLVVRRLRHQVSPVQLLLCQFELNSNSQPLLDAAIDLCEQPNVIPNDSSVIRVYSSFAYAFGHQINQPTAKPKPLNTPTSRGITWPSPIYRIVPVNVNVGLPFSIKKSRLQGPSKRLPHELTLTEKQELLQGALKLLFECEYHLLVKYVECAVPMMYAIYVAIVQQLPSAQYYPETQHLDASQSQAIVLNLLVYAGLEALLFVALHFTIKWRCGFSPTYLLAFVLESQLQELQGRLFLWYIFLLQLTLIHFGMAIA